MRQKCPPHTPHITHNSDNSFIAKNCLYIIHMIKKRKRIRRLVVLLELSHTTETVLVAGRSDEHSYSIVKDRVDLFQGGFNSGR